MKTLQQIIDEKMAKRGQKEIMSGMDRTTRSTDRVRQTMENGMRVNNPEEFPKNDVNINLQGIEKIDVEAATITGLSEAVQRSFTTWE